MRDTQPLPKRSPEPASEKPALPDREGPTSTARPAREPGPPPPAPRLPAGASVPDGPEPGTAGVDRRTADRLRKGKMTVEGVVDLHGLTRDEAHQMLTRYLARAQATGKRCILVVTGKGGARKDLSDAENADWMSARERGVLKREVPIWLSQSPNRERIVMTAAARAGHGGSGAIYVLLRRRRATGAGK
ncbi:putative DNA endonuclease SmrA [Oceanibacterium hippocampi]|uniref:Putative DNA endonuclease SmrA n=1 Tax=Oceanibacterium hippocampi TaxID=745714 RepID=A0A1Y5RP87_9PROT|nr:putative DNA endonuclease SmrA [Oceanibacterium hippocampi]